MYCLIQGGDIDDMRPEQARLWVDMIMVAWLPFCISRISLQLLEQLIRLTEQQPVLASFETNQSTISGLNGVF